MDRVTHRFAIRRRLNDRKWDLHISQHDLGNQNPSDNPNLSHGENTVNLLRTFFRLVPATIIVIIMLTLGQIVPASAARNVHLSVGPTPDYAFSFVPNNNDGGTGYDFVAAICYNVNGGGITDVDVFKSAFATSNSPIPTFNDACDGGMVAVNGTQRVAFFDIGANVTSSTCSGNENTVACANWVTSHSTQLGSGQGVKPNFDDGRCNQEPWQSFAVYADTKGGFIFYALYNSVGYYAMHVTKAQLDANPDTGFNHIIAESLGVQLWRLQGGLLQAHRMGMDGKDYYFNLNGCGLLPSSHVG